MFLCRTAVVSADMTEEEAHQARNNYEDDIMQFKLDVKNLYNVGTKSFLSEKNEGDCETFYCHVLYAYMPMIVDDTWNKFQLGCGIFNMQGFERRNKESKEIFQSSSTGRIML